MSQSRGSKKKTSLNILSFQMSMRHAVIAMGCICAALFLFIKFSMGSTSPDNYVSIRLQNQTGQDITNFWLGAGPEGGATQNTAFGYLQEGSTSRYYQIENKRPNYKKANFVINDTRQFVSEITNTLVGGKSYTFVLFYSPGGYGITVARDN